MLLPLLQRARERGASSSSLSGAFGGGQRLMKKSAFPPGGYIRHHRNMSDFRNHQGILGDMAKPVAPLLPGTGCINLAVGTFAFGVKNEVTSRGRCSEVAAVAKHGSNEQLPEVVQGVQAPLEAPLAAEAGLAHAGFSMGRLAQLAASERVLAGVGTDGSVVTFMAGRVGGGAAEAEGRGGLRGLAGASSSSLSSAFGSSDGLSPLLRKSVWTISFERVPATIWDLEPQGA